MAWSWRLPETESPAKTRPFRTPWESRFNPNGNRSKNHTNALVFYARNRASDTTPITSLPRGSVQSGFNEVALQVLGVVRVARPHRSLEIPALRFRRFIGGQLVGDRSGQSAVHRGDGALSLWHRDAMGAICPSVLVKGDKNPHSVQSLGQKRRRSTTPLYAPINRNWRSSMSLAIPDQIRSPSSGAARTLHLTLAVLSTPISIMNFSRELCGRCILGNFIRYISFSHGQYT